MFGKNVFLWFDIGVSKYWCVQQFRKLSQNDWLEQITQQPPEKDLCTPAVFGYNLWRSGVQTRSCRHTNEADFFHSQYLDRLRLLKTCVFQHDFVHSLSLTMQVSLFLPFSLSVNLFPAHKESRFSNHHTLNSLATMFSPVHY